MELSRFFNSTASDRRQYSASDFAEFIRTFYSNGVMNGGANLQVTKPQTGLAAMVSAGMAMIQGYWYSNTEPLTLQITAANASYPRIDRVVLRLDLTAEVRSISLHILEGTPAETPQPPELTRNENIFELSLARVTIPANATAVASVIDERYHASVCGITQGLYTIDMEQFDEQLQDMLADMQAQADEALLEFKDQSIAEFRNKMLEADGSGSKVDADLLDGQEGSYYQDYHNLTNKPAIQNIYSGTGNPAASLGKNGDIYVKYA